MDKGINQPWYIHTVQYYSAIRREELWVHATACMNLKSIMRRYRRQFQNIAYNMFTFIFSPDKSTAIVMENGTVVASFRSGMWPQGDRMGDSVRIMELFCILIISMVTSIYTCVKIHRTVQKKKINPIAY